jgi:hypothetical protein
MSSTRISATAAAGALIGLVASVHGSPILDFFCISNNSAINAAAGEAQLQVEAIPVGTQAMFQITNAGSVEMVVTGVYFADGTLLGLATLNGSAGVIYQQGGSPPNLPGGNMISPPFVATAAFTATAASPAPHNGIAPGQWLQVAFDLLPGLTFLDVEAALASGDLRIGLHVQGFADGGSESFVNVPAPGAALVPVMGMALAWRRRRGLRASPA